jgi:hypothetical protein
VSDVPPPANVSATDNCDGQIPVALTITTNGSCPTILTYTWFARDRCTNSASATRTVTVLDTMPPVIRCPTDTVGGCGINIPPFPTSLTGFLAAGGTASDNCDANLQYFCVDGPLVNGQIVRTHTVCDDCTNCASCSQIIMVDTIPPVITLSPSDFQTHFQCLADYQAAPPIVASAFDNCNGTNVILRAVSSINGTSPILIELCWTAMDQSSNSTTRCVLITVQDTTPPVIHCPSNITGEFNSETGAGVTYSVTGADNCDAPPVVTCVPPSGSAFPIGATTVSCNATDAATNRSSCTFTVRVLGARGTKENVLAELIVLRATVTDPEDVRKLDEAIEHLNKSLAAELWMDQTHLERKHGEKVFQEENDTVLKLCELSKSNQSHISGAVLQGFVDRIFRADRLLASIAIQEAITAGVSRKKIEQAQKFLAKGDAETGDDKCYNGIEDYKNAWKHAIRAKVSPPISPAHGRLQLEVLGEPGERFTIQASSNLVDWVTIGTCTANGEGVATFEDADAGRHPVRYYRAVSQ